MIRKTAQRRRWLRFAIPLGLVLAVILGTVVVRLVTEPDTSDQDYLSPAHRTEVSSAGLADLLRAKGITIQRETGTGAALTATQVHKGDATLFIPTPEFLRPEHLLALRTSWSGTRVVMVEPGARQVLLAVPPLAVAGGRRWATKVTDPGRDCPLTTAGEAAVTRTRYAERDDDGPRARSCYEHGLVSISFQNVEFLLVGSADPFRDDRLSEHDNAALAVDLLSRRKTLIWLDLHTVEPKPKREQLPDPPEFEEEAEAPSGGSPERPSPFPPWLLPFFVMLLLTAIAVAIARGRRLGAPVTEPLPIDVRGAETALGRSRLYRRAKARGAALESLRAEARRRLATALKTASDREPLLDALAATLGRDRDQIADILYGPEPESDDELRARSAELLLLVEQVTKGRS